MNQPFACYVKAHFSGRVEALASAGNATMVAFSAFSLNEGD
jgi:hypothetical protein